MCSCPDVGDLQEPEGHSGLLLSLLQQQPGPPFRTVLGHLLLRLHEWRRWEEVWLSCLFRGYLNVLKYVWWKVWWGNRDVAFTVLRHFEHCNYESPPTDHSCVQRLALQQASHASHTIKFLARNNSGVISGPDTPPVSRTNSCYCRSHLIPAHLFYWTLYHILSIFFCRIASWQLTSFLCQSQNFQCRDFILKESKKNVPKSECVIGLLMKHEHVISNWTRNRHYNILYEVNVDCTRSWLYSNDTINHHLCLTVLVCTKSPEKLFQLIQSVLV